VSPADDWGAQPAADDWQPVGKPAQTEFDQRFNGEAQPPPAFMDRVARGNALTRILSKAAQGISEGYGESTPTGLSDETLEKFQEWGVFHDPTKGNGTAVQYGNEAVTLPLAKAFDTVLRAANAGIHSAGEIVGQISDELGGSQGMSNRARNEVINFGNWALIEGGMGRFSRAKPVGDGAVDQAIGTLPRDVDFKTAADLGGLNEAKLRQHWQERGIHPSEALHDAERDAFLRHDLSSAAAEPSTLPPADVPFSQQPAPLPGRIAAAVQATADRLLDIGGDIQMKVAPMATGTTESMAAAKDFANVMRRNRWEWSRVDDDIAKRFTPEQRTRMWNAADEESVLRQEGYGGGAPPAVDPGMTRLYRGEGGGGLRHRDMRLSLVAPSLAAGSQPT
jgi:hypothetical protein